MIGDSAIMHKYRFIVQKLTRIATADPENLDERLETLKELVRPQAVTTYLRSLFERDPTLEFDAGLFLLPSDDHLVRVEVECYRQGDGDDVLDFIASAFCWLYLDMGRQFKRIAQRDKDRRKKQNFDGRQITRELLESRQGDGQNGAKSG